MEETAVAERMAELDALKPAPGDSIAGLIAKFKQIVPLMDDASILIPVAKAILDGARCAYQIWMPEDMDDFLEVYPEDRRKEIRDRVLGSRDWTTDLVAPNDNDWETLEELIEAAARDLHIESE